MWIWFLPVIGLVLHLGIVRYKLHDVQGDWSALLSGRATRRVREYQQDFQLTALMADETLAAGREARQREDLLEGARLLALACGVIQDAIPERRTRLQAMSKFSRMVSAVMPLPPLLPRDVRLPQLVRLHALGQIVHHLLASTQERFRWLCLVLGWCYRAVGTDMAASTASVQALPEAVSAWQRFETGLGDFKTLDARHAEAFRGLLASLATLGETEAVEKVVN